MKLSIDHCYTKNFNENHFMWNFYKGKKNNTKIRRDLPKFKTLISNDD